MLGGHRAGLAYSIAYMRALVQAVPSLNRTEYPIITSRPLLLYLRGHAMNPPSAIVILPYCVPSLQHVDSHHDEPAILIAGES